MGLPGACGGPAGDQRVGGGAADATAITREVVTPHPCVYVRACVRSLGPAGAEFAEATQDLSEADIDFLFFFFKRC